MKVIRLVSILVAFLLSLTSWADNNAPIAVDDDNYGYEGTTLTGNVGANDTDPDGDVLTYSVVSGPASGVFTLLPNGAYTYVPEQEYNGFIYITYSVCDPGGLCDQGLLELAMLFLNDPPVAYDDVYYMSVNTVLTANVFDNDIEIDDEPNFLNVLINPTQGTVVMALTGSFTYTPPPGFIGVVTFTYRTCDPCEVCDQALVTIHVTAPNIPPIVQSEDTFTSEDGSVSGSVAGNDSDPEGMPLIYSVLSGPAHGDFTFNSNGTYIYTPDLNYFGWDEVIYQACDPYNDCGQAVLTIEVLFVNDIPVANDDEFTMNEDQILNGFLGGNDYEYDDEFVFYNVSQAPAVGTFNLFNDGYFTYTPPANYSGVVTAEYFVVDPCGTLDFATVTITILPVNDPPMAFEDEFSGDEDTIISGSVAGNDSDVENSVLHFSAVSSTANGDFEMSDDGSFVFIPNENYFGYFVINYQVCDDDGACVQSAVAIEVTSVNDAPVAIDDNVSTLEDTAVSGSVATNDTDADNDILTYSLLSPPAAGTLIFNTNGSFTYTPDANDNGVYTATYQVIDGSGLIDTAILTIIITGVNDALEAINDAYSMNEDGVLSGNLGDNDSDPDNDVLTYSVAVGATNGVFSLNPNGSFSYTPGLNYNGVQVLSIQVCDAPGSCEVTTLTITVNAVNDAPVAVNDSYTINEEAALNGNLKLNDSDVDNTNLTYSMIGTISNGTFNLNANGTFTYQPALNYFGVQTAQYQVCDPLGACATASLTITVNAVNDAPVAVDDAITILEDQSTSNSVATNDTDVDSPILTYSLTNGTTNGVFVLSNNGSYTFTPNANYFGIINITYQVCDGAGLCDLGLLTITVTNVNDAPVAGNDSFAVLEDNVVGGSVATNDSDVDNVNLTYSIVVGALHGALTLNPNGNFVYTPNLNYFGIEEIDYMVCDPAGLCDVATLIITIGAINDAPIALNNSYGILVNTIATGNVGSNDTDVDSAVLTFTLIGSPQNGSITFNSNGSFTYTPDEFYSGTESMTYQVCDDLGACDDALLVINVINNNEPPIAVDDDYVTLEENGFSTNLGANDLDENLAFLVFSVIESPMHGVLVLEENGDFSYEPDYNYWGLDTFIYQVCDPFGECDEGVVTIEMQFVNDLPELEDETYSMNEDGVLTGNVWENDFEPDDELILYSVVEGPFHGTIELYNDGYFTYIPDANYFGTDYVVYSGCDPCLVCDQATLTINVLSVNDAPVAEDDSFETIEETMLQGNVSLNDVDENPSGLVFTITTAPLFGAIVFSGDGTFVYVPDEDYFGPDSFAYAICDEYGECSEATVYIEVLNINDAPIIVGEMFNMIEDDILSGDVSENDSDADEEEISYALVQEPQYGVVSLNGDGTFTYTPDANYFGEDSFVYVGCDALGVCAEATASIDVQFINDPPVVNNESYQIMQDEMLEGEVYSNDYDLDFELLLYSIVEDAQNGLAEMSNDGVFTYIPNDGWSGEDVISYQACDPCGVCTIGYIYISVIAPNTAPVAQNMSTNACVNSEIEINLLTLISDAEESASLLNITSAIAETGSLDINNVTKALIYYPEENFNGEIHIDYTICDNGDPMACASAQITIEYYQNPSPELLTSTITHESCFGENDGSIVLEASGEGMLIFEWGNDALGNSLQNLQPGEYSVSISDESACGVASEYSFEILGVEAPLNISELLENPIDEDAGGSSAYTVTGGTEPYSYAWYNANFELVSEEQILSGLTASSDIGGYTLIVTDGNGCEVQGTIVVTNIEETLSQNSVKVYPNPVNNELTIESSVFINSMVQIFDELGKLVYQSNATAPRLKVDMSTYESGIYFIKVISDSGELQTLKVTKI